MMFGCLRLKDFYRFLRHFYSLYYARSYISSLILFKFNEAKLFMCVVKSYEFNIGGYLSEEIGKYDTHTP